MVFNLNQKFFYKIEIPCAEEQLIILMHAAQVWADFLRDYYNYTVHNQAIGGTPTNPYAPAHNIKQYGRVG